MAKQAAPRQLPTPGTVLVGRLRIERPIGAGALSVVFEATDIPLNRRVAVKILAPDHSGDPEQRERFLREARAAASIANEHVARLIDVQALDDGTPFLVLEYLDGLALDDILEREGPPAIDVAIDWILQALDGVAEVHARGLVHRDIKPANLFLAERPGRPSIVKVLDFGTVKDTTRRTKLTQTGATLGSPAYMPPEQVRGDATVDARSDVWSFGVTLFELVTGELPWKATSIPVTLAAILRDPPAQMRRLRSDVPDALEQLVQRCLSKDPAGRFANAGELHVALAAVRATMPKTTRATKTIRLAPGVTPPGLITPTPYNDDTSAVRPRMILPTVPSKRKRRGRSRARVFMLAASFGFMLSAIIIAVMILLRSPRTPPVTAPPPPSAQRVEALPTPSASASSASSSTSTTSPTSAPSPPKSILTTSIAFEPQSGETSPPVASLHRVVGGAMLKCAQDAHCTQFGGRNVTVDEQGKVVAWGDVITVDTTVKPNAGYATCAEPVETCIMDAMTKHKIHAHCATGEKSCQGTFSIRFH